MGKMQFATALTEIDSWREGIITQWKEQRGSEVSHTDIQILGLISPITTP